VCNYTKLCTVCVDDKFYWAKTSSDITCCVSNLATIPEPIVYIVRPNDAQMCPDYVKSEGHGFIGWGERGEVLISPFGVNQYPSAAK